MKKEFFYNLKDNIEILNFYLYFMSKRFSDNNK